MSNQTYLLAQEAADHLRMSLRQLHARTAERSLPHVRPPHSRKFLFVREHLDAYVSGEPMEAIDLPNGGFAVRPAQVEPIAA